MIRGSHHSKSAIEKNRVAHRGKVLTDNHKERIRASSPRGPNSVHWKGENVVYRTIHDWVEANLGRPTQCRHCGITIEAGHKIHWANKDHKYRRVKKDWIRLCARCHGAYDKKMKLRKYYRA